MKRFELHTTHHIADAALKEAQREARKMTQYGDTVVGVSVQHVTYDTTMYEQDGKAVKVNVGGYQGFVDYYPAEED